MADETVDPGSVRSDVAENSELIVDFQAASVRSQRPAGGGRTSRRVHQRTRHPNGPVAVPPGARPGPLLHGPARPARPPCADRAPTAPTTTAVILNRHFVPPTLYRRSCSGQTRDD